MDGGHQRFKQCLALLARRRFVITQRWETHQLPELRLRWVSRPVSSRWEIVAEVFQLDEAMELGGLEDEKGSGGFAFAVAKAFPRCR